jgi:hypothetical protein
MMRIAFRNSGRKRPGRAVHYVKYFEPSYGRHENSINGFNFLVDNDENWHSIAIDSVGDFQYEDVTYDFMEIYSEENETA